MGKPRQALATDRGQRHNPTPEERDERVSLPLDPETAIEAILATGPHRDEDGDDENGRSGSA